MNALWKKALYLVALILIISVSVFAGLTYCKRPASTPVPPKTSQPLSGTILWHGNTDIPEVALTFDDGPNSHATPMILDILKKRNVKATFFVLGKFIDKNSAILKREADEGHVIGNHTFSHVKGTVTDIAKIDEELLKTDNLILKYTSKNVDYFRPPFGFENWRFLNESELFNYTVVLWSLDVGDWSGTKTEKDITSRIFKRTKNGTIILLHDGGLSREAVINSLPAVIAGLRKKGFKFVTIDQMIAHLKRPK
jgi:peptidoglycan/xylan/chitin deacetylase (PgdA/CDA1 family)